MKKYMVLFLTSLSVGVVQTYRDNNGFEEITFEQARVPISEELQEAGRQGVQEVKKEIRKDIDEFLEYKDLVRQEVEKAKKEMIMTMIVFLRKELPRMVLNIMKNASSGAWNKTKDGFNWFFGRNKQPVNEQGDEGYQSDNESMINEDMYYRF